jgi:hypothetical protein
LRPAELLTPPSDEAGIPDVVDAILGAPDLVSPAYWAAELIEATLGVDPFAYAAAFLAGDWKGLERSASALRNLAAFDDAVAAGYFGGLATAVSAGTPALKTLAQELHAVAAGVWNVAEAVKSLLQMIADSAVTAAISSAAGTALIETGAGAVAGYTLAAFCLWQLTSDWAEVLEILGRVTTAARALVGLLATTLTRLAPAGDFPLPTSAYDHPGVR